MRNIFKLFQGRHHYINIKGNYLKGPFFAKCITPAAPVSLCSSGSKFFYSNKSKSDDFIVRCKVAGKGKITGIGVTEYLFREIKKWGDRPAFECVFTGRKYTHQQVHQMTNRFATGLLGIKNTTLQRGDVIAIALPNYPEYASIIFGILQAGLVASPMNPLYTPEEFGKLLKISGSKAVITIPQFAGLMNLVGGGIPVITVGPEEPTSEGTIKYEDLVKTEPNPDLFLKGKDVRDDELAILPFSSGTTGPPKGVELTHSNIITNMEQQFAIQGFEPGVDHGTFIGLLPFFHIFGFHIMTNSVAHGVHCVTFPKFDPAKFVEALRKHKFRTLHIVTPILAFMVDKAITKEDLACIETIIIGAAPVGQNLIQSILKKADKYIFFQEGYGMTELSPVCHMISPDLKNSKSGSVGRPVPDTESKIIDISTGETLGPDKDGEICVRGPQIMRGYFQNPKATEEIIDKDGWLHTGDIGHHDADGCLYIVDRLKELIKVKGMQVAPAELEDILRGHPDVNDVAVIAVPDEKSGELPRAYVVKKEGAKATEKDIADFLNGKVSAHKKLAGGVEFVNEIPKSAAGKILRKDLKKNYMDKFGDKL